MGRRAVTVDDQVFGRVAVALGAIGHLQLRACLRILHAEGGRRPLAEIMRAEGLIDAAARDAIARMQRTRKLKRAQPASKGHEERTLGRTLLDKGLVSLGMLEEAVLEKQRLARIHMDVHLGEVLIAKGAVEAAAIRDILHEWRGEVRRCERCDMHFHVGAGVPPSRMRCPRCREALTPVRFLQLVEADGEVK